MHRFPAHHEHSRRILPRHSRLIASIAIVVFALFSGKVEAFTILYSQELAAARTEDTPLISSPRELKKTETIRIHSQTVYSQVSVLTLKEEKYTPTATPTPDKVKPKSTAVQSVVVSGTEGAQRLFQALNSYRQKKGKSPLSWDGGLGAFARERAEKFAREGQMDGHGGFRELLASDGFQKMGFFKLGENSSYGDTEDPVFIIESLYGQSPGHDENQLSSDFTHVGIGVAGKATNLVFGGKKM